MFCKRFFHRDIILNVFFGFPVSMYKPRHKVGYSVQLIERYYDNAFDWVAEYKVSLPTTLVASFKPITEHHDLPGESERLEQ